MKKIPFHFVYRKSRMHLGSTTMRAHQLKAIAERSLAETCDLRLLPIPYDKHGVRQFLWSRLHAGPGVYFFTKGAAKALKPETAARIRARGGVVCIDYVDEAKTSYKTGLADIHICSSIAQKRYIEAEAGGAAPCHVVLHNVDDRIAQVTPPAMTHFSAAYFGLFANCFKPGRIEETIALVSMASTEEFAANLHRYGEHTLHYVVRAQKADSGKTIAPFTKGFTAARLGCNMLAYRHDPDVEDFLGTDYPYLVDTRDEETVMTALTRAREDFGGLDWTRARERVQAMAARVSDDAIAAQMKDLVAVATG